MNVRKDIDDAKDYIIESLLSGKTPTELCKEFNCRGGTLKARWSVWLPDYKPNNTKHLPLYRGQNKHVSLESYNSKHGAKCKREILYRLLVEERGDFCEVCDLPGEWNGKKLRLQVDHVNGNSYDNDPGNLRLICPNCHTQTETFSLRRSARKNAHLVER